MNEPRHVSDRSQACPVPDSAFAHSLIKRAGRQAADWEVCRTDLSKFDFAESLSLGYYRLTLPPTCSGVAFVRPDDFRGHPATIKASALWSNELLVDRTFELGWVKRQIITNRRKPPGRRFVTPANILFFPITQGQRPVSRLAFPFTKRSRGSFAKQFQINIGGRKIECWRARRLQYSDSVCGLRDHCLSEAHDNLTRIRDTNRRARIVPNRLLLCARFNRKTWALFSGELPHRSTASLIVAFNDLHKR